MLPATSCYCWGCNTPCPAHTDHRPVRAPRDLIGQLSVDTSLEYELDLSKFPELDAQGKGDPSQPMLILAPRHQLTVTTVTYDRTGHSHQSTHPSHTAGGLTQANTPGVGHALSSTMCDMFQSTSYSIATSNQPTDQCKSYLLSVMSLLFCEIKEYSCYYNQITKFVLTSHRSL